ncbi:bifunctional diguanylate cyclase/phosphodiesterase [Shewanella sp. FJAT-52076]|uniref:putative bifunctional diguanylate cyclase/phosphodiesterase n=1 Tax=Shewanella sp. FJAT-52076 TaxID=2864202 RepID=UPI0021AC2F7E|nr:EAL domain-containing protein [Shewanella sp. FJAT-52076]
MMHIGKKFLVFIAAFCIPAILLVYWGMGLWFERKATSLLEQSIAQELVSIEEQYQRSVWRQLQLSHIYAGPLSSLSPEAQASMDSAWHERTHALGLHFYRYSDAGLISLGQSGDSLLSPDIISALVQGSDDVAVALLLDSGPHLLTAITPGDSRVLVSRSLPEEELTRLGQSGFVERIRLLESGAAGKYQIPVAGIGAGRLVLDVSFGVRDFHKLAIQPDRVVVGILLTGILLLALGYLWIRRSLVVPLNGLMSQLGNMDPSASRYLPLSADGCAEVRHFSRVSNKLLAEIFAQKEQARVILEGIADAVILTDTKGDVLYLNPPACRLLGGQAPDFTTKPISDILGIKPALLHTFLKGPSQACKQVSLRFSGRLLQCTLSPIDDHQHKRTGALLALRDVTAEERLKAELRRQAEEDAVTGLPNRTTFEARMKRLASGHDTVALCYLDLEQFKIINDSCGHLEGDRMLCMVAKAFQSCLAPGELLGRVGGDEFGILLLERSAHEVAVLLKTLQQKLAMQVLESQGQCYRVGVSIGVAFARAPLPPVAELFKDADIACVAAKQKGSNQIHFYDDKDKELNYQRNAPKWALRIAKAIHNRELELYFQPIHSLHGRSLRKRMEILLRIRESNGRILPPAQFIASAERFKLMPEVDKAVVAMAMEWLAAHPELWHDHCLSINLSGNSLGVEGMESYIVGQLKRNGIPPACICFEITETTAIQNRQRALDMLRSLRKQGFAFAIDDFGSGFASYGYLRELPVDYVKIDGCFVRQLASNAKDYAIVKSIHDVCSVMGIETVAEFVESQDIMARLEEIGINYAQGYAVGRPKPLVDYAPFPLRQPA